MLVLTRRANQSIHIGDDIHIKILDIRGRYVRIGVDAPKEISVYRNEIYQKMQQLSENHP